MTGKSPASKPEGSRGRRKQLRRVIDECRRRRHAGEGLPDEKVIAEHPDLMPELGEALAKLRRVEEARREAFGELPA